MDNKNIGIFLDLDSWMTNIGEINSIIHISNLLEHIIKVTSGHIVLKKAYASRYIPKEINHKLMAEGFTLQSAISSNGVNLANIQLVADAVETIFTQHHFQYYALITDNHHFVPLVQKLQQYKRQIIGCSGSNTEDNAFSSACDSLIYYGDLVTTKTNSLSISRMRQWIEMACQKAFHIKSNIPIDAFHSVMQEVSQNQINEYIKDKKAFRKAVEKHGDVIQLYQEETMIYVQPANVNILSTQYKTYLKQLGYRIVTAEIRLAILYDMVICLKQKQSIQWEELTEMLVLLYQKNGKAISRSSVNYVMRAAKQAGVLNLTSNNNIESLSTNYLALGVPSVQVAIIACDQFYINEIRKGRIKFDINQLCFALYGSLEKHEYIKYLSNKS